ncbi:protein LKAAEAR1-like isoform X1 [Haliotis asinina]|uniref:protein LKAAEAR1-like isoform X1 n=1 Tax=Haliotis asinina TaxID=109174 RepID=UPI003531C259
MPSSLPPEKSERNRKKLSPFELKKLSPQERSRYLAYEEPPKHVSEAVSATNKRLVELKKARIRECAPPSEKEVEEKIKHDNLIGQLKAAESRNRLRIMRLRYQANRAQEISHLIACQPVALKAVRLQALLPPYPDTKDRGDRLDKLDRERVEQLLEDTEGLQTNRIH